MKRIIYAGLLSVLVTVAFGQLKVTQDGKVGIGITTTPVSNLAVGSVGEAKTSFYFKGYNPRETSMFIESPGFSTGSTGLYVVHTAPNLGGCRGVCSQIMSSNSEGSGRAIALLGLASNYQNGYNYGVIGVLGGSKNGTGIFGSSVQNDYNGILIDGRYAGYFSGNVKVTGTINGTVVGSSDVRYKQNITDLGSGGRAGESVLKQIAGLKPISYNFKQVYHETVRDSLGNMLGHFDEKTQVFRKKHYGLIAQDLQEIYPDLV